MKKFLLFLVSLVVVVCLSLTTYYFMRNNEVITIKTKEIYCNAGDTIPLKSLGINIKNKNISKKTAFNYNAGGDEVTKYIKYDEQLNSFVVSSTLGGEVTLVISTTNKKYADFTITVHIGDGSVQNPYYLFNETDLEKIGSLYRLDKSYLLMNDINLTEGFEPIGYNAVTSSWNGFGGTFDGQNHTITGLNLTDKVLEKAGLFSSINAGASVKNLIVDNATISGEYKYAGILAGTIAGDVEKVAVKNSSVNTKLDASFMGAFAGYQQDSQITMCYADNVKLDVGEQTISVTGATVGGFIGKVSEGTISACYVNNIEINNINNSAVEFGGFVSEFVIGTDSGSIQQSYSNTTTNDVNYGAFINKITTASGFDKSKANMLRYLIGNIAVVYGKTSDASIVDTDVVKTFDNTFFKNMTYANRACFYEKDAAMYLVRGFAGAGNMIDANEYIYYAVNAGELTTWDTTYVWDIEGNKLPTLRMGNIAPTGPSSEYLRRDLEQKALNDKQAFLDMFKQDIKNENIKFLEDIDLSTDWTPIALTNTTIDGNGKTVTVNLNKAVGENLGLFSIIENSTIKNLNIIVTGVSANATNAGGLAGIIKSSDKLTTSTIENVTITYQSFSTPTITNFGGIAGKIENTTILACTVSNLTINKNASIENAGAIVAENNGTITDITSNATIYASEKVGGVVAINNGTITTTSGNVIVNYNKAVNGAVVGGVAGENNGTISGSKIKVNINVSNAGTTTYVGGVAGDNNGTISDVSITAGAIEIRNLSNKIYVGGVAGINDGKIESVNNKMTSIGTYNVGKDQYVGGVVAINNGTISKVLTHSNLNGNTVGGVVAIMNKAQATIDQVAVGKYDATGKKFTANTIKADKYIAGVVVDFRAGKITNIQCVSNIQGQANSTRSSLVALIFPYGATLKNATIDSSLSGYGTFYRETWTDFASYTNKAEFGLANGETGDERYNIYKYDTYHGIMQSVVINSANKGVSDAKAAMGSAFAWGKDYQDTEDSSFVKLVDGFNDISQFQGSFTFVCSVSTLFGIEHKATKTLTFEIGKYWESNNGISLMFLKKL